VNGSFFTGFSPAAAAPADNAEMTTAVMMIRVGIDVAPLRFQQASTPSARRKFRDPERSARVQRSARVS
jgi:hypothetical protein